MKNSWQHLPKPFFVLAPMEGVTDTVFRQIVADTGKPDLMFTEFVNVEGLFSKGKLNIEHRFKFVTKEQPLIAQIWGLIPENFYKAAQYIRHLGFSGIDLNFGCPQKEVVKKGACIALINNRKLATEIIKATKAGSSDLPVSVKTRLGLDKVITQDWIGFLLKHDLAALTIHGRTANQMSKFPVHWDEIGKAVQLRNRLNLKTLIVGNGDVENLDQGLNLVKQYRVDGIMIGRGILKNLWFFEKPIRHHTTKEKLNLLVKHAKLFEKVWGSSKNWMTFNKYLKIYCQNFSGAAQLRQKLITLKSANEIEETVFKFLKNRQ